MCFDDSLNTVMNSIAIPIGSMYAIYGDIYHQYTPNVSIYTIHGSYGIVSLPYRVLLGFCDFPRGFSGHPLAKNGCTLKRSPLF